LLLLSAFLFALNPIGSDASGEIAPQPWIRVAIVTGAASLTIGTTGAARVQRVDTGELITSCDSPSTFTFVREGSSIKLPGMGSGISCGLEVVCVEPSDRLQVNGRTYRGFMRVVVWRNAIACVNVLPIEEYLWGVVPCEVPDTWPPETLRAQAVAARTYSLRGLDQYPDRPFDVYATVADQVYHGTSDEAEATTSACVDTVGEICAWNGKPIAAYYHSTSGGWTASSEEIFGRELPYLRPVPSRDESIYRWTYRITAADLKSALRASGYRVGQVQRAWVHRFSGEGRAEEVKFVHEDGILLLSGAEIRRILGPSCIESTYFRVEGQFPPEIPTAQNSENSSTAVPGLVIAGERDGAHPTDLLASCSAVSTSNAKVISSDGIGAFRNRGLVAADGLVCPSGQTIWIAEPVRAEELQTGADRSGIFEMGRGSANHEETLVEDPGNGVGIPSGGYFVFVGQGCGHGVGMSQHGARILAESGWTYVEILRYFYTGIEIARFW
jgi:stage II sporulation protein D